MSEALRPATSGDNALPALPPDRRVRHGTHSQHVAASLDVENPGIKETGILPPLDLTCECEIELPVTDIRPYDKNPRHADNPRFTDIKASIKASGVRNPLTVTRRPGEQHFMVESGGNTRLLAAQQLWAETADPRFERLSVIYRPWRSETHVLAAHLIENEQRGEMSFFDKASAIAALKREIEAELGIELSIRQFERALKGEGLSISITVLTHYLFAAQWLSPLAQSIPALSGLDVRAIQPRLNSLRRRVDASIDVDDRTFYGTILKAAFDETIKMHRGGTAFDAIAFCNHCDATADHFLGRHHEDAVRPVTPKPRSVDARRVPVTRAQKSEHKAAESVAECESARPHDAERPPVCSPNTGTSREEHQGVNPTSMITDLVSALIDAAGLSAYARVTPTIPYGVVLDTSQTDQVSLNSSQRRAIGVIRALVEGIGSSQQSKPDEMAHSAPTLIRWLIESDRDCFARFVDLISAARTMGSETCIASSTAGVGEISGGPA